MRKYFFEKKLEEGVLVKRPGRMSPSVIINGMESGAACPLRGVFPERMEYGIPCLAGRGGAEDFYRVYAISLDHPRCAEKKWICISKELIGQVVRFFLEGRQMERLAAGHGHAAGNAVPGQTGVDYLEDGLMVEIKCPFAGLDAVRRNRKQGGRLMPAAWKVPGCIDLLNSPDYGGKRAVFLMISQQGLDGGQPHPAFSGAMYGALKTALCMGVELWSADLKLDEEGVSLASYRNISGLALPE